MPHHLLLATLLHDHRDPGNEVSSLLSNPRRRRVQAPPDDSGNLRQVRLHTGTEGVHHRAKAVQHHRRVVGSLLLEGVDNAVDDLLLKPRVDIRHSEVCNHLVDGLHNHLTVGLRSILEILHDPPDDVSAAHLVRDLHGGVHELAVVAPVQGHANHPKVAEEGRQDVFADVVGLHTLCGNALLHNLQDDLLHLFVRGRELTDKDDHHLSRVVVGVLRVHEGNDVTDGLEERSKTLTAMFADTLPQGPQHCVEGLDAVWRRGLGQSRQRQCCDGPDLLLLVLEAVRDDIDHLLQVGKNSAAHEDSDLLDYLDARVASLPTLLRLAHSSQEKQQRWDSQG
mmetsp:Transcript_20615/g.45128  ORF Transcript_20615/g.45128 Transcript_20615/m.45128 type:complete len:338 (+) Transcript_20615:1311-2324(+)